MKKAYNRLITPEGEIVVGAVVVFDDTGTPVSWHKLRAEESFVEWSGGVCYLHSSGERTSGIL